MTINATGHRSEFVYDGLGRRVEILEKEIAADQTETVSSDKKYLWVGTAIAEERTGTDGGTVVKQFFGQGFVDSDGTKLLYTRDHLGSIRELVDMAQNVRARYDYDPYGRVTKVSGDRDSVFLYTGHFWHAQGGLYLTLFRAYDPNLGRWLSRDPKGEVAGTNLYAYVLNGPIGSIDPYGLDRLDDFNDTIAGYGDGILEVITLSLWNGEKVRDALGIHSVNECSDNYRYGRYTGMVVATAVMLFGGKIGGPGKLGFQTEAKALEHFTNHGGDVAKLLGETNYSLAQYLADANHVIKTGTYIAQKNAYYVIAGGVGSAKVLYVGVTRAGDAITTFYLRNVGDLARTLPNLFQK